MAGVSGPTPQRLALAQRVRAFREDGLTYREICERLGISHSYAQMLWADPDGSVARARKDSYGGTCRECGKRTTGSSGRAAAPELCRSCAQAKVWTHDAVVTAIQRFAAKHGRPPLSDEWVRADPIRGYPPGSSVYRSQARSTAPFARWADAIEAAGFPRPYVGWKSYQRGEDVTYHGYIVMRESAGGAWEIVGENDETNQVMALNAAMNGHAPEGRWVAVPKRHFRPRSLKPRTVYDFVEDTVTA